MCKDNKILESVFVIYEDVFGFYIIIIGFLSEDLYEVDDIDIYLWNYKVFKEENEVLIGVLGENLIWDIVDVVLMDYFSF